jgi:hypothetical protein
MLFLSAKVTFCVSTSDQSITSGEKHAKHYTTDAVYWRGKLTTRHKSLTMPANKAVSSKYRYVVFISKGEHADLFLLLRSFSSFMITNIVMYLLLLLFTALYILGSTFFYSLSPVNSAKPNSILQAWYSNISAITWRSVLLVEETGENHRPVASLGQTLSHNVVSSTPRYERGSNSQL